MCQAPLLKATDLGTGQATCGLQVGAGWVPLGSTAALCLSSSKGTGAVVGRTDKANPAGARLSSVLQGR